MVSPQATHSDQGWSQKYKCLGCLQTEDSPGGQTSMGKNCGKIAIVIGVISFLIVLVAFLASSLKRLEAYEVGVGYDVVGRRLGDEVKSQGLYAYVPGSQVLLFPNVFKVMTFTDRTCLNKDGATITISVTYQFRPRRKEVISIIRTFRDYEKYTNLLKLTGESELQKACSLYNTFDIIAKRADFAQKAKELIAKRYDGLGSDISGLQVDNIGRPEQYTTALKSKEGSRENIVVTTNERPKRLTQARIEFEKAIAEAQITMETAEVDARITTLKAKTEAEAIKKQFMVEAAIYKQLRDAGFTGKSLLSYIEVDAISSSNQPVFIGLESPVNDASTNP